MFFTVTHAATYTYSHPVFLEPHTLRLRPRNDSTQRLLRFHMQIEPQPAGLSESIDLEGNAIAHVWFAEWTSSFAVTTTFALETLRSNPFDYILIDPAAESLPMTYDPEKYVSLAVYCTPAGPMRIDDSVAHFAKAIADEVGGKTLAFLAALNRRIHAICQQVVREYGDPQPSEVTLAQQEGSCRDLAVLFIDACRTLGIGARFVSGYQESASAQGTGDLHAWAEVYLPGGGWRGYDPTQELAVADRHIAVAAGIRPQHAAPIIGGFRGIDVSSHLQAEIKIHMQTENQSIEERE